ncbi:Probable glycosyltransferase At3g07620 [Linum grandiflorum]
MEEAQDSKQHSPILSAAYCYSLPISTFLIASLLLLPNLHGPSSSSSTSWTWWTSTINPQHHHVPDTPSVADPVELEKIEASLAMARALIKEAASLNPHNCALSAPHHISDYVPHGNLYRNPCAFHRSYLLMEKLFKIFVYKEGEPPLFHDGPCKNIYSTEGLFINLIETDHTNFTTRNPDEAHVYFLPFSVVRIVHYLFLPLVRDKAVLERTIVDYVSIISHKYPFWNRSLGADHFMLSCHDWGPRATWYEKKLYYNSIRVLCNANTSENFNPKKDVSFPEINLPTGEIPSDSKDSSLLEKSNNRSFLAFFAGRMHGKIRPLLFKHWKDKDDAHVKVYETLPQGGVSYQEMMKKSKFCLCPSGHEVASPRIPEAIYADCVPVLISQDYVPPFSDILNWEAFSVQVSVEEIHNLKSILMAIPEERYLELVNGVRQVRRHFENEGKPYGSHTLPKGIISATSDLEMRSLWGNTHEFPAGDFVVMLFHYDGNVDEWKGLDWSNRAIHISAINQTKWWFAKRFLHPEIISEYAYIFLWDEDLGVDNFDAGRFVEMMAPVFSKASWRCIWHMFQGDRTKNIGIVDSEYIVHEGLPTLGGSASDKVRKMVTYLTLSQKIHKLASPIRLVAFVIHRSYHHQLPIKLLADQLSEIGRTLSWSCSKIDGKMLQRKIPVGLIPINKEQSFEGPLDSSTLNNIMHSLRIS